jgi:hypothetical protein
MEDLDMIFTWKRTVRTPTSERFLALLDGDEVAAVDLHYLAHTAAGTVILLNSAQLEWTEARIEALLASLDDDMLPGVDIAEGTLTFTVVRGEVVANYESNERPAGQHQPRA